MQAKRPTFMKKYVKVEDQALIEQFTMDMYLLNNM